MEDIYVSDVENSSEIASISCKIVIMAMIVLFFVLAFCFLLSLYARWYLSRVRDRVSRHGTPTTTPAAKRRRGLDRATLNSLPMVVYDPKDFKEGLECSVCLSETLQGEKVRLLPNCNHGFHLECIDMWFKSHSTCPLCRNLLVVAPNQDGPALSDSDLDSDSASGSSSDSDEDSHEDDLVVHSREALAFPTNVLFWGNEAQVRLLLEATNASSLSTSSQRDELVIEIPIHLCDDSLPFPPSREEETKTPVVSRLGSLKRLLSRGTRVAPWASSSSSSSQVESEPV